MICLPSFILLLLSYTPLQSQSLRLKHEMNYSGQLQMPFIKERTIENPSLNPYGLFNSGNNLNSFDFENDGIPEFFVINQLQIITKIDIYDGATCTLKYSVTIDSATLTGDPAFSLSFMDVDGDNTKELVGEFTYFSSNPINSNGITRLLFIDVKANKIKYSLDRSTASTDGYQGYAFYDIDNDGYLEVICKWHSSSDSTNKLRIYGGSPAGINMSGQLLAKKATPILKNMQNPISGQAKIEYYLTNYNNVLLNIFDSDGRIIRNLVNSKQPLGEYSVIWNGKTNDGQSLAPGQYFYQLKIGDFISTKKVIFVK